MDAQCISNTTRVCAKALEKHFFLLPPCAVVATTVAFQEKGIFSWPFLGFHIYLKIPIASLTQKNGRHHGWRSFAALFVTIPTEDSALMALPGLLWLGWVRLGACQNICMCIPPSKTQRLHKPNARHIIHTRMGSRKPAGDL